MSLINIKVELQKANKRIAELEAQNLGLTKTLLEFEQDYEKVNTTLIALCESLPIRDLEQQAKGVEDFEKLFSFYDSEKDCELVYSEDAISYCAKLRKQAANLKEQK